MCARMCGIDYRVFGQMRRHHTLTNTLYPIASSVSLTGVCSHGGALLLLEGRVGFLSIMVKILIPPST